MTPSSRSSRLPTLPPLIAATLLSALTLAAGPALADSNSRFFRMDRVWNDRFSSGGPEEASESRPEGFLEGTKLKSTGPISKYFEPSEEDDEELVVRVPDPITVALADLRGISRPLDLELGQVATIESRGIQRYLATTEEKVEFFLVSPSALQMKGAAIGTTIVHVWDLEGRVTVQIRVIPQKSIAQYIKRKEERVERADSFKIEYTNNRSQFYQGNDFEDLGQNSLAYSQGFKVTGDLPVGKLDSSAEIREVGNKPELSHISAKISDFHYGSVKDADLSLADTNFRSQMLILPQYRFRGVQWEHRPEKQPFNYTAFYGRELTSILGTLGSTSDGGQETLDSYAGGGFLDWEMNPAAKYRFGYVQAHGQSRADELNNHGYEFDQTYRISEHMDLRTHTGFDSDHFSNRIAGVWRYPQLHFKSEFRDTSKRFFTIVGNPGGQGEQGLNLDLLWTISEALDARVAVDIYRDRQFFLPGEYDRFNTRQDASIRWRLAQMSTLQLDVKDYEETALISPYRNKNQALTFTQGIPMWDRRISVYSRLVNDDTESLSNSESNYRRNTLGLGLQAPLWYDLYFSYQHNISLLEETFDHTVTHPRSMVYSLSRRARVADTPLTTDVTIRYTDEEETESQRSFMIGEDRLELQGSLTYTIENFELFLDGRYGSMRAENSILNEARAEAEVVTGVRYLYDTQVRWEPQAKFFGMVFLDRNGDGLRQPDESGVAGQLIRVAGHEVTTDGEGRFQTPSVGGKRATLILDPNKIPYGHTVTGPLRRDVALEDAGKSIDFGLVSRSSAMGLIFNDINGNGKFDPGDFGIAKVKVVLDGKTQRVTENSGRYRFDDIPTGTHKIQMDLRSLPIGYLPVGPMRKEFELSEGVQYRFDCAVTAERTVNGRVFVDLNGNKFLDAEEPGVPAARVRLGALEVEADADGYYLFERVPGGTHTLAVVSGSGGGVVSDFSKEVRLTHEPAQIEQHLPVKKSE